MVKTQSLSILLGVMLDYEPHDHNFKKKKKNDTEFWGFSK